MQLWTPLFKEAEVGEWDSSPSEPEEEILVIEPEVPRPAPRLREPSPEAVKAAKGALRQAAKNSQIVRDQETIQLWITQNLSPDEDATVGNRLAALAFHRDDWSLSRIARALDLDVSTVSRWMTRAKQAEQAEAALQKGMDQRRAELRLKSEQVAKSAAPAARRQPRLKVALPRPLAPLSAMAKRSVGILKVVLEQAETSAQGILSLPVASAMERERIMAILSLLDVQTGRPVTNGKGFLIPIPPEEAAFLTRTLAQS
ncbi:helix-turn-helix domain-containing protein [Armatimonas sp.]|uniref:helix-turn-helix domain-containing protein n=1 Tax=Armatimonas sp. TaxID=1872638 RepID=UPI00374FEE7F